MNRIDTLPPEIELAQLLQRCAAQDSVAFRTLTSSRMRWEAYYDPRQ